MSKNRMATAFLIGMLGSFGDTITGQDKDILLGLCSSLPKEEAAGLKKCCLASEVKAGGQTHQDYLRAQDAARRILMQPELWEKLRKLIIEHGCL